jgi:FAD/FMN-containing dehydrogenase
MPVTGNATAFKKALHVDNTRVRRVPFVVLAPKNEGDVVAALALAQHHGAIVSVRGGGHSAAGYCLNDGGVVIDMTNFNSIELDDVGDNDGEDGNDDAATSITVGAGVIFSSIYAFLEKQPRAKGGVPVAGACPTVGVVGFTCGGGYSFLSRSWGVSADNLLRARIVTRRCRLLRLLSLLEPFSCSLFRAHRSNNARIMH